MRYVFKFAILVPVIYKNRHKKKYAWQEEYYKSKIRHHNLNIKTIKDLFNLKHNFYMNFYYK